MVILPDRELFNLSFEMLTPKTLKDFFRDFYEQPFGKVQHQLPIQFVGRKTQTKVLNTYDANYVAFALNFRTK